MALIFKTTYLGKNNNILFLISLLGNWPLAYDVRIWEEPKESAELKFLEFLKILKKFLHDFFFITIRSLRSQELASYISPTWHSELGKPVSLKKS